MKCRSFTKLICAGMASGCVFVAAGQEKATEVRITDREVFLENRSELRAGEKERPDSVLLYDDIGRNGVRVGFTATGDRPRLFYSDSNESWCEPLSHFSYGIWPKGDYEVKYNSNGLVESISFSEGDIDYLKQYKYNANACLLSSEDYQRPVGGSESEWKLVFNDLYLYDTYENWIGHQSYYLGRDIPELVGFTYSARVDNKGRIVYSELKATPGYVLNVNGRESEFQYYIWYYSDGRTPNAEIENNTSVGSNNQGSFDLNINVPADSIQNGSLVVQLPEGFTLDEENTSLTIDFAGLFDLTITKQENNSWLLEIKPKTSRSTPLRADEIQKAIQVAYRVDEEAKRGSYDISVNGILFTTPGGDLIPEPAITVPAVLNRWGVANEAIEGNNVWVSGRTLYVRTNESCPVSVYAVGGQVIIQQTVSAGETAIPLPQGIYFIKAGDTSKKVMVR